MDRFEKVATKVSLVSIIGNLILSVFKFLAGILAHSSAMISDSIHSGSDVLSSVVVIIGVHMSAKDSDKEHPYGHERLECVVAILLSTILLFTGLAIGFSAIQTIYTREYLNLPKPGILALIAALVSIICKELMYWYTRYYALKIDSSALMADAWHHRSDSLSSIGALIGIGGAMMGYPILDCIASIVICIFIAKAAYDIFMDSIDKMVDHSCDDSTETALKECALETPGVLGVDLLRTRVFGNKIYVDIEICADGSITLTEGHSIAEQVHDRIEQQFPKVKHIMVHVNPYEPFTGN